MCVVPFYVSFTEIDHSDHDQRDAAAATAPLKALITVDDPTGLKVLPHWLAQPYFRHPPNPKPDVGVWILSPQR